MMTMTMTMTSEWEGDVVINIGNDASIIAGA